jgi:YfiH family protein
MPLKTIKHNAFDNIPNIKYGFYTRQGGVSTGVYESLNIAFGTGDSNENVRKNLAIIAEDLGLDSPKKLLTSYQTHTNKVFKITKEEDLAFFDVQDPTKLPNVDGLVTNMKGIAIGARHADCGNALFVDEIAEVVGSAHAGWKGALDGITDTIINEMVALGASKDNIKAVLGPCIRQVSYQVTPDFAKDFLAESPSNSRFFMPSDDRKGLMFDLAGYIKTKIRKTGVKNIFDINLNTYSNEEDFFSYRRNAHAGEEKYGAQLSVICLK